MSSEALRLLPSIERMLARPAAERLSEVLSRDRVRDLLREILEDMRKQITGGQFQARQQAASFLIEEIERRLETRANASVQPSLKRVVNATGVIIHTNLGRAPMAYEAVEAISEVASHY